jgi:hypothetical protein
MSAIMTAVNNGNLTAEEAAHLVQGLEGYAKIFTVYDLEIRIEALEKRDDVGPTKRITRSNHSI